MLLIMMLMMTMMLKNGQTRLCHTHLVVPGSLIGSVGHTGKVPTAEFPCKARVFGSLAEIPRQDLLYKLFAIQHHKAFAVW